MHQHAPHIGMMNDSDAVAAALPHRAPLHPRTRMLQRLLIGALGDRHTFQAHTEARVIHHGEHVFETAIGLTHQIPGGATRVAVLHDAGRTGMDAQLVLDRQAFHVVAHTGTAIHIEQKLRHDEQRNALHALGRIGQARQHQMHDVLCHIVLAPGNENLGAADFVMVAVRLRTRSYRRKIRTGLRFSEIHGTAPRAGYQARQVTL